MQIKIGKKFIGDNGPCFMIAEAGSNWRYCNDMKKNYKHALRLIHIAVTAKADAVKFQVFRANKLYVKDAGFADYIGKKKSIYNIIEEMELPYEWLPKLKNYCDANDIIFLATPFDEVSADHLEELGVEAYKVASYSINNIPLLRHIAKKQKPIIISTGASNIRDIEEAVGSIKSTGNNKTVLNQCTGKYPAPLESINLRVVPTLIKKFKLPVGFSDHSREPFIAPLGAVALGAKLIEKHYTSDNSLEGPDHAFAIIANELKSLVDSIRKLESCMGSKEKKVTVFERELFKFARQSIHATIDIKKGEKLTKDNIAILRNGKISPGLHPRFIYKLLGKRAKVNIKCSTGIKWKMVE